MSGLAIGIDYGYELLRFRHRELGESAKQLYTYERSQKLLSIVQRIIDERGGARYDVLYIRLMVHQKIVYEDESFDAQIAYLLSLLDMDESWIEGFFYMFFNFAVEHSKHNRISEAFAHSYVLKAITEKLYSARPHRWAKDYATCLSNLAFLYRSIGQTENSIELARKAIDIIEELYAEKPHDYSWLYANLLS